jgi:hypothetical protein
MCEPALSIVQFPSHDPNSGNPVDERINNILPPVGTPQDYWGKMKKKISSWFHFARMGFGHSETLSRLTLSGRIFLPTETRYECLWYERRTLRDGIYHGHHFDSSDALQAADLYSRKVATGNLTTLRQFLESSIRRTERPHTYLDRFAAMLNSKGKNLFIASLGRFTNLKVKDIWYGVKNQIKYELETIIKIMMGFTRKRRLLVPEWADDNILWA